MRGNPVAAGFAVECEALSLSLHSVWPPWTPFVYFCFCQYQFVEIGQYENDFLFDDIWLCLHIIKQIEKMKSFSFDFKDIPPAMCGGTYL